VVSMADDSMFDVPANSGGPGSSRPSAWRGAVLDALARARRVERRSLAVWATAVGLALLCVARFGLTGQALIGGFFVCVLVVLSAIDLAERRLPNRIVLPATAIVLSAQLIVYPERALEWVLAACGAACFLALPMLVNPSGMGMGDVKLALLLGAGLGVAVAPAIVLGVLAAGLFSLVLVVRSGLGARKSFIAFGPFLSFGAIVAFFLS
jgi:leader peptidase (prepilin peptidase) / N-methyltransferase